MKMKGEEEMERENKTKEDISKEPELGKICLAEDDSDNVPEGMKIIEVEYDRVSDQSDESDFESIHGEQNENNDSEDEYYDAESVPCIKQSLTSLEAVCDTAVLIIVVHGGSILDQGVDMAAKESDITTFRGAVESISHKHYPNLVGHLVIKHVFCSSICSDTLDIIFSVSADKNNSIPLTSIPLFAATTSQYQEKVSSMADEANKVYQKFLESEKGLGFSGEVCLVGDSVGAMLAYDALCPQVSGSESKDHVGTFKFEVSNFVMFGSPIPWILAHRKSSYKLDLPKPNCLQIYNLFHASNPVAGRLEPLVSSSFSQVPSVTVPRYRVHPLVDGRSVFMESFLQSNQHPDSQPESNQDQSAPVRMRKLSNEVGKQDSQGLVIIPQVETWWGEKRMDFALHCPDTLASFPPKTLPHIFHSSYWESADVISFILRQLTPEEEQVYPLIRQENHPTEERGEWIKKRTSVKVRNGTANHRANDVIVLEGKEQVLQGRFSYGSFDVAALSGEKVDIYIMEEPNHGEWTFLATELTDKKGRITYKVPLVNSVSMLLGMNQMFLQGVQSFLLMNS